jgi:hypothetical protein
MSVAVTVHVSAEAEGRPTNAMARSAALAAMSTAISFRR